MKNCTVLKRIINMVVILPLLITTTGLTVHLHYCDHSLYDIGVFSMADNCCIPDETMNGKAVHDHCAADVQQKGHCKDETLTVSPVDAFLASVSGTNLHVQTLSLPVFLGYNTPDQYLKPGTSFYEEIPEHDNAPPGVNSEPSFLQSFLI